MELLTVYNYILDEHMRHLQRNHMNHHHGHLWQPWKDCRQHQARLGIDKKGLITAVQLIYHHIFKIELFCKYKFGNIGPFPAPKILNAANLL